MSTQDFARQEIKRPESGCILKIKTNGRGFRGLIDYQSARGADMNGRITQLPFHTNMLGKTSRELSREFSIVRRLRPQLNTCVGHLQICPSRALQSKEDWIKAIEIALKEHDIYDAPFVAYLHAEGDGKTHHAHIHIAFSRIRFDGSVISDSKSFRKNERASRIIEERFGLGLIRERPKERRPHNSQNAFTSMRRQKRILKTEQQPGDLAQFNKGEFMATQDQLNTLAFSAERAAANSESADDFKTALEALLKDEGVDGRVEFSRRGDGAEIFGYSLTLDDGGDASKVKASDIGRHLSWPKIRVRLAENAERARQARMRRAWDDADAAAAVSQLIASAAKAPLRARLSPSRARPTPAAQPAPAVAAKPGLYALQPQGVRVAGFDAHRGELLDEAARVHRWEYRRAGTGELCFVDTGASLELVGDSLANPADVAAFVDAAAARLGTRLTLEEAPEDLTFLAALAEAAERAGVQIIDGRTGKPLGATQGHKPDAAAERAQALREHAQRQEEALAERDGLDALEALGLGMTTAAPPAAVEAVPAADQAGVPAAAASVPVVPAVPAADDLEARRLRAGEIKLLAQGLRVPTNAELEKMDAGQLRDLLDQWSSLQPVVDWAAATVARHERESRLGRADAASLVLAAAEEKARLRGEPLTTEIAALAETGARAELKRARDAFASMSILDKAAEAVSGKRAAKIGRLEQAAAAAERATLRARRDFATTQETQAATREVADRQAVYLEEREALGTSLVAGLGKILAGVLQRILQFLERKVGREESLADAERERKALIEKSREPEEPEAEGNDDDTDGGGGSSAPPAAHVAVERERGR